MQVKVFVNNNGACPYLDNREWVNHSFVVLGIDPRLYEGLQSFGWRRSGSSFYQNHCPNCKECVPLRVDVNKFTPDRSQRRNLKRNHDVTWTLTPPSFEEEDFQLYRDYVIRRHGSEHDVDTNIYSYLHVDSPMTTQLIRYRKGGRLMGVGWIDVMPDSLSSVYFSYNLEFAPSGPGVFSILKQIEIAREMGKSWLYLGFHVADSRKMAYKSRFKPHQILVDGQWRESNDVKRET